MPTWETKTELCPVNSKGKSHIVNLLHELEYIELTI